jgi:murein DD-endopeptidase MepM/ murein hydrolase activator NlpD
MATYTVKKGDTLSDIAKQFGTTYQEIAKNNGISNPNIIHPGQVLNIGETKTETPKTETPTTPTTPTAPTTPKYEDYVKSDAVTQAEAMLQQHMANKPGEYSSPWQAQLNDILNKILNREDFSYDLNGDVLYQQYKDQFVNQGKQASMDVMGQVATMTGGHGNSYAQTVGQQTYQGYLLQLNDKVPELYQLALNQYNQEEENLYKRAALLEQQDEKNYGRYRDEKSDFYTELDRLTDEARWQSETDYGKYMDDKTWDYQLDRDSKTDADKEKQSAYDTAMAMISLGVTPSAEMLERAGLSSADVQAMVKKVLANEKKKVSSSSSSGYKPTTKGDPVVYDDGGLSTDAIKKLQRKLGVKEDGVVGKTTWDAIQKAGYKSTVEAYKDLAGGYASALDDLKIMKMAGDSNAEAQKYIQEMVKSGVITSSAAATLYNKYRDNRL